MSSASSAPGLGSDAVLPVSVLNRLARERLERLFDPDTPFLEFSALAAWDQYDNEAPGAGLVTGVGVVHGREDRDEATGRDIAAHDATRADPIPHRRTA